MIEDDSTIEVDLINLLQKDNRRMKRAGSDLAAAALHVVNEYDGVHRLMLAVAGWARAIADEGDRGERHRSST